MLQAQKIKIAIYSLVFLILIIAVWFSSAIFAGQARDYERLGDLKVWQDILEQYYFDYGTYQVAGCQAGMTLAQCLQEQSDKVRINTKEDPINSGNYRYVVGSLGDSDYEIKFSLESGVNGLAPGQYVWTRNGLKK